MIKKCDECWKDATNEKVICEECYSEIARLKRKYEDALKKIADGTYVWFVDRYWLTAQQLREIAEDTLE